MIFSFLINLLLLLCLRDDLLAEDYSMLVEFKKNVKGYVERNEFKLIYDFGKEISSKTGISPRKVADLITKLREDGIEREWLDWFEREYGTSDRIGYKEFAAAIFFPYELLCKSHKKHPLQFNYAIKACLYFSSILNPRGKARKLLKAVKDSELSADEVDSSDKLMNLLDISLMGSSSIFAEYVRASEYLKECKTRVRESGTVIQKLNMGYIILCVAEDEAKDFFSQAEGLGSLAASSELGSIMLKRNSSRGISYYRSLGTYGLWKIAQCYRYGVGIDRDLTAANEHYLLDMESDMRFEYPEIHYDAADFAVYYAHSQPREEIFCDVMREAIRRFVFIGSKHLWQGYFRALESILQPEVARLGLAAEYKPREILIESIREGNAEKSEGLMRKLGMKVDE
jgi:hypothetical protein